MGPRTAVIGATPQVDGYFKPAEYGPHRGCWLLWPERPDNWRLDAVPAQQAVVSLASAIARFEPVRVGVSLAQYARARAMLPHDITVVEMDFDDAWARDTGPTCVIDGQGGVRGVDWEFNGWGGGVLPSWERDRLVAKRILEYEGLDRYVAPLVLEPGSFDVDGDGALLTTEECLLNTNRNPTLRRPDIECLLEEYLGIRKIIWLRRGIYQDETDGHVDNLARFARPGVVALTWTDDRADPQYEISCEALESLSAATDAQGRRLEIYKIHQPSPLYISQEESEGLVTGTGSAPRVAGQRLAASYVNFYSPNGGVIVPQFGDARYDIQAYAALQELFPDRQIVPLPAREIVLGGGGFHCMVQDIGR